MPSHVLSGFLQHSQEIMTMPHYERAGMIE